MIAYLTSGKTGLHSFTYSELKLLEKSNVKFTLCLTQFNKGAFLPDKTWNVEILSIIKIIIGGVVFLFTNPINFNKCLLQAIKENVVVYFFSALSFYKLRSTNINFIHCQMGDHKLVIGYFISRLLNIKLTTTIHAHEIYSNLYFYKKIFISNILNKCEKIITISNYNKKALSDRLNINPAKIEVMYLFPTNFNDNYFKKKKILIVANWFKKKGYEQLLQALKIINRDDYVLWAVGGWTKSDTSINLSELVKKYSLEERVIIYGTQPKKILDVLFASCDFFCLPSITDYYDDGRVREKEGIPVAIMEAIYWEKPVIVTNHAGNTELVSEIVVKEFDIHELANKINYLLDNPSIYNKIGKQNKEKVLDKFSEKNISVLTNLFLE